MSPTIIEFEKVVAGYSPSLTILNETTLDARRGEITLLIGKADESSQKPAAPRITVRQRVGQIMSEEKLDEKGALKKIAKEMGISKSEAYRELQRSK